MDLVRSYICTMVVLWTIDVIVSAKAPVVRTTSGPVSGRLIVDDDVSVTAFFGIPYGRAPKGQLRFAAPQPVKPWTAVRSAERPGNSCHQSVDELIQLYSADQVKQLEFDEDCLNLNVFIPGVGDIDDKDPLAVMVWFSGRTMATAAPNLDYPHQLSSDGNIIVVTVNYRVGVLGYYTTAKGQVNGNLALLDQQMALKWVRDNIERFSGDVRRITIAGEDAGSEAVSLHVISPMSSGLFSSAISFGRTMVQKHLPRPGDLGELSAEFAGQVGCQSDSESSVLSCLRRKDARQLNAVNVSFPFVVDGAFLPDDPLSLWNRSIANPVNYVIGCRSHDTALERAKRLSGATNPSTDMFEVEPYLTDIQRAEGYPPNDTYDGHAIRQAMIDQYFDDYSDGRQVFINQVRLRLDTSCLAPADRIASFLLAANRQSYLFEFDHRPKTAKALAAMSPAWYLLGNWDKTDSRDRKLSDDVITMISTFVRRGFPIWVDRKASPPVTSTWPAYQAYGERRYAALSADFSADDFRSRLEPGAVSFWNVLLPALVSQTRMAPEPSTLVIEKKEESIISNRTLIYVLIFLAVLCVVLFFGMLGAFFLWHDARHGTKLKKYKEDREEENKYSETIDY